MSGKDVINPLLDTSKARGMEASANGSLGSMLSLLPLSSLLNPSKFENDSLLLFLFLKRSNSDINGAGWEWVYFFAISIQVSTYF